MLERLEVKGFKSIREMNLELHSLNALIGANGAGKSNFISLFQLVNRIIDNQLQLYVGKSGGPDNLLHFGQRVTDELSVKLSFAPNNYQFSLVPTQSNTLVFSDERCSYQADDYPQPYEIVMGAGHPETNIYREVQNYPGRVAQHVTDRIKSWKIYHFHDTSDSSGMKQLCNINDNLALRPDASNLSAFLLFLNRNFNQHYQNIVDTIRLVAPFFNEFVFRPSPFNNQQVQLEWRETGSDAYLNAHSLSDGTLRFICLTTLLLQPDLPSVILLDEPELGLHPYAITLLADLLKQAATKTQVIAATQSVTLINRLEPADIIVVDREEKQSVFRHLDNKNISEWLDDYGLGELWEKNTFGGRP
jgi:predicted ATPase